MGRTGWEREVKYFMFREGEREEERGKERE